ncbi:lipopolysaccharide biosynthesis protein, partial [Vibrio lentus]
INGYFSSYIIFYLMYFSLVLLFVTGFNFNMAVLVIWGGAYSFTLFICSFYQAEGKSFKYGLLINAYSIITFVSILLGVYLQSKPYIILIPVLLLYIPVLMFLYLRPKIFDFSIFSDTVKFCIKQMPHMFANVARYSFDRFYLVTTVSAISLVTYNLAMQAAMMLSVFFVSINKYWFRHSLNYVVKAKGEIKTYVILSILVLAISGMFFILSNFYLTMFFSQDYSNAVFLSKILIFGFIFQGLYFVFSPVLYKANLISFINISSVTSFVIYLLGIFFFGEKYQEVGVAIAFVASWFTLFIITFFVSLVEIRRNGQIN